MNISYLRLYSTGPYVCSRGPTQRYHTLKGRAQRARLFSELTYMCHLHSHYNGSLRSMCSPRSGQPLGLGGRATRSCLSALTGSQLAFRQARDFGLIAFRPYFLNYYLSCLLHYFIIYDRYCKSFRHKKQVCWKFPNVKVQ